MAEICKKILIVDDDKEICELLNMFLTLEKYCVVSANTGMQGIEIFRKEPDYSLYFDSASFDQLIKNQKEGLVSLSKKLAFNGVLLYIVPTSNLNETAYVVKDFIEKNQDSYSLDLQRMYVPTKEENSILYFALIRRIK